MRRLGIVAFVCLISVSTYGQKNVVGGDKGNVQTVFSGKNPESGSKDPESLSVLDFGAKGDGITDDTEAFQKALNSLGSRGGTV